ncbi:MAG: F0F1 ATP synthase subunit delta [Xanthobacteraceae bacterium]
MHIDWWTLALQTVNVLVLIWILARFFFRPVVNIVAKRQEQAKMLLAASAAARQEAAEARAEAEKARAQIGAERDRLMAEARKSAEIEKANLLVLSSEEIARLRSEAEAAIARGGIAAKQAIIARASELSVEIARRLLGRLRSKITLSAFLDELCQELRALPSEERERFTSVTGHATEVVTAAPLSEEEMGQVGDALTAAFGSELAFDFRADPSLIAGIELHSRNTIVRNSWRADLDRIRGELSRDEHTHGS